MYINRKLGGKTCGLFLAVILISLICCDSVRSAQKSPPEMAKAAELVDNALQAKEKMQYNEAISLFEQAIEALPEAQQKTRAIYLNELGALYYTIAEYQKAEPLYKRALVIDLMAFGKDHQNVGRDLNNLALLYQDT